MEKLIQTYAATSFNIAVFFILYVSLFSFAASAYAATYYVDNIFGSDFNDGLSTGTAWKTLSKVNGLTGSSTNVALYSQNFNRANWWASWMNSVVTDNATTAPDGTVTAALLREATTTGSHYVRQGFTGLPDNTVYTLSAYVKPAGCTWVQLFGVSKSAFPQAYFRLEGNGYVGYKGSVLDAKIVPAENGFYRISMTVDSSSGGLETYFRISTAQNDEIVSYAGSSTLGLYVWGAQMETGAVPTNYKVTTSTSSAATASLEPGDGVLLKKGAIFYESLKVPASGTADDPITIGAYGAGANPVLDGSSDILGIPSDWSCAANYCTKKIGLVEPNVLYINGSKQPRGSGTTNVLGDWTYTMPNLRIYVGAAADPIEAYTSLSAGYRTAGVQIDSKNYVRISDLTLRRFNDNTQLVYPTTTGGVVVTNSTGSTIENSTFTDNGRGISAYKSPYTTIDGNTVNGTFVGPHASSGVGILVQSDNATVINNTVNNQLSLYDGSATYAGIGIQCAVSAVSSGAGCINLRVDNNDVSYTGLYGISVVDNDATSANTDINATISRNRVMHGRPSTGDTDGIAAGGREYGVGMTGLSIWGNRVDDYLNSGIQITNLWRDAEVYKNILSNVGGSASGWGWGGVKVNNGGIIANNTVYDAYQEGISIGATGTVAVASNIVHTVAYTQAGHGYCFFVWGGVAVMNSYNNNCHGSSGRIFSTFLGSHVDGGGMLTADPVLVSAGTDFTLRFSSPAIDAGTTTPLHTSTSTDFYGNPIYGTPDIGAIEYQPPYVIGTHDVPATGAIRLYADGKFRERVASSTAATSDLMVTPQGGWGSGDYREYMDLEIDSWTVSSMAWTATSSTATTTVFTVGGLTPNGWYNVQLDAATSSSIGGGACTDSVCQANGSGVLAFTYSGSWSTHSFEVTPGSNPNPTSGGGVCLNCGSGSSRGGSSPASSTTTPVGTSSAGTSGGSSATSTSESISTSTPFRCAETAPVTDGLSGAGLVNLLVSLSIIPSGKAKTACDALTSAAATPSAPPPAVSSSFRFSAPLAKGTRSDEVRRLQQFLNTRGFVVTTNGLGSPGNETNLFGLLTEDAVKRFQAAYAAEILVPVGLTAPSGFFGPSSIRKANALLGL